MARHSRPKRPPTPAPRPRPPEAPPEPPRHPWIFWVVCSLAAVALRLALIVFTRGAVYPADLDDFVRWGVQAANDGVLTLYDRPPPRAVTQWWVNNRWEYREREFDRICNYPPGSIYLLYVSGAAVLGTTDDWKINDVPTRLAFGAWGILADVLLAAGCAAIFAVWRSARSARWLYLFLLLLPPFWWDSVRWQQLDTVVLAPLVWMLYFMVRGRWIAAGVLWGVAFALKPQAILFSPVWVLALFVARPYWRAIVGGVAAMLTLGLLTLPFTVRDGLLWLEKSYAETMFGTYTHITTLKAFNLWYLHALVTDSTDARQTILGISCLVWGKLLMVGGLLATLMYFARYWRGRAEALVLYSALAMLIVVMLPTQVHERYIVLALPFLAAATGITRRMWFSLVLISVVAQVQMAWPLWLTSFPGEYEKQVRLLRESYVEYLEKQPDKSRAVSFEDMQRRQRAIFLRERSETAPVEWMVTLGALLGTGLAAAGALTLRTQPSVARPPGRARAAPARAAR